MALPPVFELGIMENKTSIPWAWMGRLDLLVCRGAVNGVLCSPLDPVRFVPLKDRCKIIIFRDALLVNMAFPRENDSAPRWSMLEAEAAAVQLRSGAFCANFEPKRTSCPAGRAETTA
jgi:hypothetical protein